MLEEGLEIDQVALRTSTSGRKCRDAKACTAHALAERMETDAGAYKFCGRGGSRASRKERRVTFGREKKNGKRNDPGKAQSINGCGAEVKYCSDFGLGQARPALFFWRA
jgi:hypothetical protein